MTRQEINEAIQAQTEIVLRDGSYLEQTDYQTIRSSEGGEPMSEDTRLERAAARERINAANAEIERLNAIEPEEPERPDEPTED